MRLLFIFLLMAFGLSAYWQGESAPDAAVIFRDEVISAERKLKWKGPILSDETLLAVALSGLSWDPASGGKPLLVRDKARISYSHAPLRLEGFQEARLAGRHKIAVPFAFSLILDPGSLESAAWRGAYEYLDKFGVDFDAAIVGVMQSPEKLPVLPEYLYSAADSLVHRASPRLIPFFLTLAESDDAYLRSRGVTGIGIAAFRARPGVASAYPGLPMPLKESSISAAQRRIIGDVLQRASEDESYRVRAAAALSIGLAGEDEDARLLERLSKDRAYLSMATESKARRVVFPVRAQAALSLTRFGKSAEPGGGVFGGKELQKAVRGGRDVTRDQTGIRRELLNRVNFHDGLW